MTPRDGEDITLALFDALGLPLKRIPTNDRDPRPDFETTDDDGQRYIVETKTRLDSEEFIDDLRNGRRAESRPRLDHDNATEEIVKSAARQVKALRSNDRDVAILCYVLAGFSPEMQVEQLCSTLWGTIRANDVRDIGFTTDCYYLGHTGFLRYPELDGVIAIEPLSRHVGFYPNRFSPRRIQDATLGRSLATVTRTPEEAERHGRGVVVPLTAESPGTFRSRLRAIQVKTGRLLSPMRHSGLQTAFRVAREEIL